MSSEAQLRFPYPLYNISVRSACATLTTRTSPQGPPAQQLSHWGWCVRSRGRTESMRSIWWEVRIGDGVRVYSTPPAAHRGAGLPRNNATRSRTSPHLSVVYLFDRNTCACAALVLSPALSAAAHLARSRQVRVANAIEFLVDVAAFLCASVALDDRSLITGPVDQPHEGH